MKGLKKQSGQLLIIYLTTLFIGGSSVALGVLATGNSINDIEKGVKTHVLDTTRQKQSLALLEQWENKGKAQKKKYKKQRETLLSIIKEHDTDKAAFKRVINEILTMDKQTSKQLLDIQYNLRKNMTSKEWAKIFSDKTKSG